MKLDLIDVQNLFDIFNAEINKHRHERKMAYLCNEISKEEMAWHQAHADYLEKLYKEIRSQIKIEGVK